MENMDNKMQNEENYLDEEDIITKYQLIRIVSEIISELPKSQKRFFPFFMPWQSPRRALALMLSHVSAGAFFMPHNVCRAEQPGDFTAHKAERK